MLSEKLWKRKSYILAFCMSEKIKQRKASRRAFYSPCIKSQIHPLLGQNKKLYASRLYQLKTGNGAIGTFFEWIGAVEPAECWWCGDGEQSLLHLYINCRSRRSERRVLKRNLDKIGIRWQRRPEKKRLAELLANQRAIGPLLLYLKDTGVGDREGAIEMTMERRRGCDRK